MLHDMTLKITPKLAREVQGNEKIALAGHLGTHFDVMNREFPLEYFRRRARVFDVSEIQGRDIESSDIELDLVCREMFVVFYSGFVEKVGYGNQRYFKEHPQLSQNLIDQLLEKGVSMIGVDFAGVRRGKEHTPTDQRCADKGVFIVENLCNLKPLAAAGEFTAYTLPMNYGEMTGLPCRVVGEIESL